MLKSELLKLIESIEDSEEVDEALKGTDFAKSMLSLDNFKNLVATDKDFKSFMDSEKDKYNSKAFETWKTNNLQNLIDEKIKELYPEDDPKDNELVKLKQEMENMKKEKIKEQLTNKALKKMTDEGLPTDLVDFLVGVDEDSTVKNIDLFKEKFTDKLETTVKERLKDSSYTPPSGGIEPEGGLDFISVIKDNQVKRD
ncbi:DUF4355 domain-containing protein [Clostridium sp. CTA-1]